MTTLAVVAPADAATEVSGISADARDRGWSTVELAAAELGGATVTIDSTGVRLDGDPLDALWFAATPDEVGADDFVSEDRSFASIEARSVWTAISAHPAVVSVNRLDEEYWFGRSEWGTWRARFSAAGLDMAPLRFDPRPDDRWLPWSGWAGIEPRAQVAAWFGAAHVDGCEPWEVCFGRAARASAPASVGAAAFVMAQFGVNAATVLVGEGGRLVGATSMPGLKHASSELRTLVLEGLDVRLGR